MSCLSRASLALAMSSLALSSCSHMPVTSMLAFRKVDFATTELARLRAAVKLPSGLKPQDTRLTFIVEPKSGGRHERSFTLVPYEEPGTLDGDVKSTERIYAYRFAPADLPKLEAFRDELARARLTGGGSLTLNVGSKACHEGGLPSRPVLMTTYLRTAETGRYVPLVRDIDLAELKPGEDLMSRIPPCGGASSRDRG